MTSRKTCGEDAHSEESFQQQRCIYNSEGVSGVSIPEEREWRQFLRIEDLCRHDMMRVSINRYVVPGERCSEKLVFLSLYESDSPILSPILLLMMMPALEKGE